MRTMFFATGVRVGDKRLIEKRVELSVERVMYESVAHARLVYVAGLWVGYAEVLIAAMRVDFGFEVCVKLEDIVHQVRLKFLHIFLPAPASAEFSPRGEQIFDGDDIVIGMRKTPLSVPPPTTFAHLGVRQRVLSGLA